MTQTERAADIPGASEGRWFFDPSCWADMDLWHEAVAEIRKSTPVLYVDDPMYGPFWALTRHADVFAVSRDNTTWNNTLRSVLMPEADYKATVDTGLPLPKTLVHMDGTEHRDHRQVTNDWFKPAAVGARQQAIDEIADLFIAKMRDMGGECDFAADVAAPFTLRVIMSIYGVPEEDEPTMLALTQGLFGADDPEYGGEAERTRDQLVATVMEFVQYFNDITDDRRACPTDDLATVIANAEIDGCPLGNLERLWYYIIVATAGHDTTSFALSGGMNQILKHPDQLAAMRADPGLAVNAADEIIRWTSPVRHFMRYAQTDTEIRGVELPAGSRVLLSYPSANRDANVFEDPMQFNISRPDADKLLSFGVGAHFCLGAHFARREVRTMMTKLAAQLEWIELAGEPAYAQSHFVSGVKHLPVTYAFN